MEKLTGLLNEWSKTALESKCNWTDVYDEDGVYFVNLFDRNMTMEIEDVIGKRAGFIKWLVDNDKINKDIISRVLIRAYVSPKNHISLECEFYDYYESLLMLLSISDTPIEDLILYLK